MSVGMWPSYYGRSHLKFMLVRNNLLIKARLAVSCAIRITTNCRFEYVNIGTPNK